MRMGLIQDSVKAIKAGQSLKPVMEKHFNPFGFTVEWVGFVMPKERPRFNTKTGATYTPQYTRDFEDTIKKHVADTMRHQGISPLVGSVRMRLHIYDKMDVEEKWSDALKLVATENLVTAMGWGGDIDNKAKSILDALNKVAYRDDRQVVQLEVTREYREITGFLLMLDTLPSYLPSEITMIEKML